MIVIIITDIINVTTNIIIRIRKRRGGRGQRRSHLHEDAAIQGPPADAQIREHDAPIQLLVVVCIYIYIYVLMIILICMCMYVFLYIYIYMYVHTYMYRHVYISMFVYMITSSQITIIWHVIRYLVVMYGENPFFGLSVIHHTVSFHNFKSQNFKLSVSNPKSKCVAYLSVLSRISNCQGLGRKNKFEILKTDRRGF